MRREKVKFANLLVSLLSLYSCYTHIAPPGYERPQVSKTASDYIVLNPDRSAADRDSLLVHSLNFMSKLNDSWKAIDSDVPTEGGLYRLSYNDQSMTYTFTIPDSGSVMIPTDGPMKLKLGRGEVSYPSNQLPEIISSGDKIIPPVFKNGSIEEFVPLSNISAKDEKDNVQNYFSSMPIGTVFHTSSIDGQKEYTIRRQPFISVLSDNSFRLLFLSAGIVVKDYRFLRRSGGQVYMVKGYYIAVDDDGTLERLVYPTPKPVLSW